jgi:hypothetical protein
VLNIVSRPGEPTTIFEKIGLISLFSLGIIVGIGSIVLSFIFAQIVAAAVILTMTVLGVISFFGTIGALFHSIEHGWLSNWRHNNSGTGGNRYSEESHPLLPSIQDSYCSLPNITNTQSMIASITIKPSKQGGYSVDGFFSVKIKYAITKPYSLTRNFNNYDLALAWAKKMAAENRFSTEKIIDPTHNPSQQISQNQALAGTSMQPSVSC